MKLALSYFVLIQTFAFGVNHNTLLQFTMKNVSKDATVAEYPSTQQFPTDVEEERLVNAITRARTAQYLLQVCDDKKEGELAPTILKPLTAEEKKAKLATYSGYIQQAIAQLKVAENQLLTEHAKSPEARDFKPMIKTFEDLNALVKAAHSVFQETE